MWIEMQIFSKEMLWRTLSAGMVVILFQYQCVKNLTTLFFPARPGLGRLSLYNKNASYERELRREEYRKFLLRIKRQNKRCHATESESEKLEDPAITPPVTKVDNELRKLRPRRIALDEGEEKPKRKINRGRQLHTARKKYTLRSTPPKRSYWRKRGFIPVSELRMAPLIDVPAEPLGPEAEIISEMKKLVVCKDIGETVMHKAARLGNKVGNSCSELGGVLISHKIS